MALTASQLVSAVKSEALKLTGLAHEPHVARSKKRSAPSATTVEDKVAIIVLERAAIRAISRQTGEVLCVSMVEDEQPCSGIYQWRAQDFEAGISKYKRMLIFFLTTKA